MFWLVSLSLWASSTRVSLAWIFFHWSLSSQCSYTDARMFKIVIWSLLRHFLHYSRFPILFLFWKTQKLLAALSLSLKLLPNQQTFGQLSVVLLKTVNLAVVYRHNFRSPSITDLFFGFHLWSVSDSRKICMYFFLTSWHVLVMSFFFSEYQRMKLIYSKCPLFIHCFWWNF